MTNHTEAGELKPCPNPWCASHDRRDAEIFEAQRPILMPSRASSEYAGACPCCPMQGPWRDTEAEAIAAWNTRTPTEASTLADQEPVAWREGQTGVGFCFDDGILNLNRDGSGGLCFRDDVLEFETNDETGKLYRYTNIAPSEIRAIRDELNKWFPPTPVDRNAVLEEAARELIAWYGPFNPTVLPPEINGAWLRLQEALRTTEAPAQGGE